VMSSIARVPSMHPPMALPTIAAAPAAPVNLSPSSSGGAPQWGHAVGGGPVQWGQGGSGGPQMSQGGGFPSWCQGPPAMFTSNLDSSSQAAIAAVWTNVSSDGNCTEQWEETHTIMDNALVAKLNTALSNTTLTDGQKTLCQGLIQEFTTFKAAPQADQDAVTAFIFETLFSGFHGFGGDHMGGDHQMGGWGGDHQMGGGSSSWGGNQQTGGGSSSYASGNSMGSRPSNRRANHHRGGDSHNSGGSQGNTRGNHGGNQGNNGNSGNSRNDRRNN